jgi:DNA polymerase kappa
MRDQVKAETGLTVSAGISTNTLLSKIATDINKPDGQCVVDSTREASMAFMRDLPIRKVPGIGRVNERWLQSLGVNTVNDIYEKRGALYLVRNSIALGGLLKAYLGLGSTIIEPSKRSERKGVGVEQTFRPTSDMTAIVERLGTIAESLAADLSESGFSGRTINLRADCPTPPTRF